MRSPLLALLLPLFLCTCGHGSKAIVTPDRSYAQIRYNAAQQVMSIAVDVRKGDSTQYVAPPTAFNVALENLPERDGNYFQMRRPMNYPSVIPMTFTCGIGLCAQDYNFAPVYADSFPTIINKSQKITAPISTAPLMEGETLTFFFEPEDRSAPQQLKLLGPTADRRVTLPSEALANLRAGPYDLYLVKSKLTRDSTEVYKASAQLEYISKSRRVEIAE